MQEIVCKAKEIVLLHIFGSSFWTISVAGAHWSVNNISDSVALFPFSLLKSDRKSSFPAALCVGACACGRVRMCVRERVCALGESVSVCVYLRA